MLHDDDRLNAARKNFRKAINNCPVNQVYKIWMTAARVGKYQRPCFTDPCNIIQ